jgi:putative tricarboxylic transport membrane protein
MKKDMANNIFNFILVMLGATLFIAAQGIETGAAMAQGGDFMPKLLSGIWLVISILNFLYGIKLKSEEKVDASAKLSGFLSTLILLVVYLIILRPLGFVLASMGYLFVQMYLIVPSEKKTKRTYGLFAVLSIGVPIAVSWIFANVFSLILPMGLLR